MWPKAADRPYSTHSRGYWVTGLLLSLMAYGLMHTPLHEALEWGGYERLLSRVAHPDPSGKVVLLESGDSITQTQLAEGVGKLSHARAVAILLPLAQRENDSALEQLALLTEEGKGEQRQLDTLGRRLDGTAQLAAAIKRAGNVRLATHVRETGRTVSAIEASEASYLTSFTTPRWPEVEAVAVPQEGLLEVAKGSGLYSAEAVPFMQYAAMRLGEEVQPSLFYRLLPGSVQRQAGASLAYRYYPRATVTESGGLTIHPFSDLLSGALSARELRGKTVLIGDREQSVGFAAALAALLGGSQISVPEWTVWAQYGALAGVALFLMLLLPRLGLTSGILSTLLLLFVLLNSEFLSLLLFSQWLPLLLPATLLLCGYGVITLQRRVALSEQRLRFELSTANMQLGRMLQSQGELEQAWEKYRRCLNDEALREQLYSLGLDFERKRQYNKAVTLFEQLQCMARNFRDVAERLQRNREMGERIVLPQGNVTAGGTVVMKATQGLQRPTLGHYHIEKEIGRGAMGMVYLGQDPRINREVAIKTMALSHEFEGEELKEVKERFFREAETAGRLNHPNIVTIYDVGEEQELAYIAMDYLRGEDLSSFSSKKTLLPLKEVMAITEQVAEALEYAHRQNVVHRDIKPANIVYERAEKVVRVTDFGVACLTDASKTKTGTVLGSPSYMSPEQVAGKRVDGRADIFSLGVTLYQLTTGQLPFEAESLGSLMFKIANQPHPKPGKYRSGIPICLTRIINKCLQKEPGKRYQSAAEVAAALKRCRGG